MQGLDDELRPARPPTYDDEKAAELINRALQEKPNNASAWSVRLMAQAPGVSKSTVQRWFSVFRVRPHRAIKRGSFDSVAQLVKTLESFIERYCASSSPLVWVATAESIFTKLEHLSARICGT